MPRFFSDGIDGETAHISGADAWHIARSLRMRTGDMLTLCSGSMDYSCRITAITDELITLAVDSAHPCEAEPSLRLTLYQAVPKQDKLELIVQKATELGAVKVVPVLTARCISRPDAASFEKKRLRLVKIAEAAAKQSGRGIVPEIGALMDFSSAVWEISRSRTPIMCCEHGGCSMSAISFSSECALLIGSEGGFSPDEVSEAQTAGINPVWLGNRILRCETAPLAAISIIMHITGNM